MRALSEFLDKAKGSFGLINEPVGKLYFSIATSYSPFSKDMDVFFEALHNMDFENGVQTHNIGKVLPNPKDGGKTGIAFGVIADALSPEQQKYFERHAKTYPDKISFDKAQQHAWQFHYDITPDPG